MRSSRSAVPLLRQREGRTCRSANGLPASLRPTRKSAPNLSGPFRPNQPPGVFFQPPHPLPPLGRVPSDCWPACEPTGPAFIPSIRRYAAEARSGYVLASYVWLGGAATNSAPNPSRASSASNFKFCRMTWGAAGAGPGACRNDGGPRSPRRASAASSERLRRITAVRGGAGVPHSAACCEASA